MKTIYIFGNSLLTDDSLPIRIMPELSRRFPDFNFTHQDPNEDFPPLGEKNPIIIDTVAGIREPMMIDISDLKSIEKTPVSPHDYDLLFHLLLLKKLGKIDNAVIFGVPQIFMVENTSKLVEWFGKKLSDSQPLNF